ncbi:hypothetical protein BDZ89DRAFT_1155271 [Hymenopellis radicata]|nr:hypothetical protein BDZ89DRAFT_1155271 [Hymenopellis radicata]
MVHSPFTVCVHIRARQRNGGNVTLSTPPSSHSELPRSFKLPPLSTRRAYASSICHRAPTKDTRPLCIHMVHGHPQGPHPSERRLGAAQRRSVDLVKHLQPAGVGRCQAPLARHPVAVAPQTRAPLPPTPLAAVDAKRTHHRYSKPLPSIPVSRPVSDVHCSRSRSEKGKGRAAAASSSDQCHDGHTRRRRRLPTVPLLIPLTTEAPSSRPVCASQSTRRRDLPIPPPLLVVTPTQPSSSTSDGRATPLDETPLCSEIDWDVVMDEILHRFSSVSSLNVNIIEEETPSLAKNRRSNYASMMYEGANGTLNGLIDMHLLHV